jgi:hypothetical protein|eukprot:scaffold3337_cov204-Alexandrium_tamarense.AAC.9
MMKIAALLALAGSSAAFAPVNNGKVGYKLADGWGFGDCQMVLGFGAFLGGGLGLLASLEVLSDWSLSTLQNICVRGVLLRGRHDLLETMSSSFGALARRLSAESKRT